MVFVPNDYQHVIKAAPWYWCNAAQRIFPLCTTAGYTRTGQGLPRQRIRQWIHSTRQTCIQGKFRDISSLSNSRNYHLYQGRKPNRRVGSVTRRNFRKTRQKLGLK